MFEVKTLTQHMCTTMFRSLYPLTDDCRTVMSQAITLNGQTPGPTIRCVVGDSLVIQANNKLDVPMSIHCECGDHQGSVMMDRRDACFQVLMCSCWSV